MKAGNQPTRLVFDSPTPSQGACPSLCQFAPPARARSPVETASARLAWTRLSAPPPRPRASASRSPSSIPALAARASALAAAVASRWLLAASTLELDRGPQWRTGCTAFSQSAIANRRIGVRVTLQHSPGALAARRFVVARAGALQCGAVAFKPLGFRGQTSLPRNSDEAPTAS